MNSLTTLLATYCMASVHLTQGDSNQDRFQPIDVFGLEHASDPQIAPHGRRIVYVRNFMDIMKDVRRSNLWSMKFDGSDHRPLTTGSANDASPRWSPDANRLLYVSRTQEATQIYLRWMDTGQTARLTQLTRPPSGITWSPDGRWIAFSMLVPEEVEPFAKMPSKPKDAEWAPALKVIQRMHYRHDGRGYLDDGYNQLFVLPSEGGTPRQITSGPFDHSDEPAWARDGESLVFSANRHENWEHDPLNSEIYEVSLTDGAITALTDRRGPDRSPAVSPDGTQIAYLGFDDELQGYQRHRLYVMQRDGNDRRVLTETFDRDVAAPVWSNDGLGVYFQYDDKGDTKIGFVSLRGEVKTIANNLGGESLGRPYSQGSFSVARDGRFACTYTQPEYPADVAVGGTESAGARRTTTLNQDLLDPKTLGQVEEFWYESSHDGRPIQAWIITPPDFDPQHKYPLILEIHGGPFANYGNRFSAEMQLYAAAGYVVLYANPRGSTGYGEAFGNLIHHAYPGYDYDDLMSGVDAVLERGYVDPQNLFVTGGSGGGVLSSWIVGKTDRFRAAVVAKPVINWYSFVLTSDAYNFFYKYWFPGFPWDHPTEYLRRSPLSLVGNVTTPTMLITGESDHRTPISESEQYYQALKLRKVPTAMVRVPEASHSIAARPSHMIAKVSHVLAWFEKYRTDASVEAGHE